MFVAIVSIVGLVLVLVFSLCKVASNADQQIENDEFWFQILVKKMKAPLPLKKRKTYQLKSDQESCIICGKPVQVDIPHKRLWIVDCGASMATLEEEVRPADDMGTHAVGNGCARKKAIKPFVLQDSE